ncbi:MAG: hypothetical protein WD595_00470 [Waddliaceae bacterium]
MRLEEAVACGRQYQEKQTGYIHFCHTAIGEDVHYPIPVRENLLFAFALLRTRQEKETEEAWEMIAKLLAFQTDSGNFPIYLHHYPKCYNHRLSSELLPILDRIIKHFRGPYDEEVKRARDLLFNFNEGKPHSFSDRLLSGDTDEFFSRTYHARTESYIGPHFDEECVGNRPKLSLYHMLIDPQAQCRSEYQNLHPLEGALVGIGEKKIPHVTEPVWSQEENWSTYQCETYGFSTIDSSRPYDPQTDQHLAPFRMHFGTEKEFYSLVCQGGNHQVSFTEKSENKVSCLFTLGDPLDYHDRVSAREVEWFLTRDPSAKITVNGHAATTFNLGDLVEIRTRTLKVSLRFLLVNGTGNFVGHLMLGNRPSQLLRKGKWRQYAFDRQIFLRTLRRDSSCQIQAEIEMEPC